MTTLADAILIVHFLFVLFVACGLPAIWIGAALGWGWVRNFAFRIAHLAAILFVSAESLIGIACPLTVWEDWLRQTGPDAGSFMQRWVGRVLYYNLPEWAFTATYAAFFLLTLATYVLIRPHKRTPR